MICDLPFRQRWHTCDLPNEQRLKGLTLTLGFKRPPWQNGCALGWPFAASGVRTRHARARDPSHCERALTRAP